MLKYINPSNKFSELSDDSLSEEDAEEEGEEVKTCWSDEMTPRPKEEMPRRLYETAFDSVVVRSNESESERAANRSIQLSTERSSSEHRSADRETTAEIGTERLVGEAKLGLTSLSIGAPRRRTKYSSSDTSSSGGSLESVASECSGSESRRSSSLSSHGSESPVRLFSHLNVLSPISDKSQEPEPSPSPSPPPVIPPPRHEEAPASDSGISVESRNKDEEHVWDAPKSRRKRNERRDDNASLTSTEIDKVSLDTPKTRRRIKQGIPTELSSERIATSVQVELEKLPFDMPKLRRKLRNPLSPDNVNQLLFEIPKHRRRSRQISPRQERASSLGPPDTESPSRDQPKLWRRPRQISPPDRPGPEPPEPDPELEKLPFDMPKLRRNLRQTSLPDPPLASDNAVLTEVDKLPFDMPKLRRKLGLSPTEPPSCSFKGKLKIYLFGRFTSEKTTRELLLII